MGKDKSVLQNVLASNQLASVASGHRIDHCIRTPLSQHQGQVYGTVEGSRFPWQIEYSAQPGRLDCYG